MGSDAGGERAASIYSLVETAKLNGLDPQAYLREVLTRIADHPHQPHRRVAALEHRAARSRAITGRLRQGNVRRRNQEGFGVNSHGIDPRMIEALEGASSLQLYQLKAVIDTMLGDPRRSIAARANLHLGQPVQFVDFRDGQMRRGKIITMRDTQATVLEEGTKRTWKIPCLSMQAYAGTERRDEQAPYEPPPEPAAVTTHAREFQRGDTVTFDDREGRNITGVIVRINQRTATLGTGDGGTWRVPFHVLRHVLDV